MPVSQSHIRAVLSPLPLTILDDDFGENCIANIASPWPGIVEAHLETARTRKTACGAAEMLCTSSVLISPGLMRAFQILVGNAVVTGSAFFLSGTGRVKR